MKIITHQRPDADALAALYLAERYLFAGKIVTVGFVGRGAIIRDADCVVDVGNEYDPARLRFDHKPPAFPDRNTHCATRLLYDHLRAMGKPVETLSAWVAVVHEGDSNPPRRPSQALQQSRASGGFHAFVRQYRKTSASDTALYESVREWLDREFPCKQLLAFSPVAPPTPENRCALP